MKLWLSAGLAIASISAPVPAADPQKLDLNGHATEWLIERCNVVLQLKGGKLTVPSDVTAAGEMFQDLGQCFGYIQGVVDQSRYDASVANLTLAPNPYAGPQIGPHEICPEQYKAGVEDMARHLLCQYSPTQDDALHTIAEIWITNTLAHAYPCKGKNPASAGAP